MDKHILPVVVPPIKTYQDISFTLAVIMAYKNLSDVYFNNYINLECNMTDDASNLKLIFTNATWEEYRISGLADMNMYYIRNLSENKFDEFLQERIDQGNYIIMYCVDEYFLSYTPNYGSKHFIHDTYIYGYDYSMYHVMAYKNRKLQQIQVPKREITRALFSQSEKRKKVSFCTFRPSSTICVSVNTEWIAQEYVRYVNSIASGTPQLDKVYGIRVYDELQKCVQKRIDKWKEIESALDLRPFRCIWEQKKIALARVEKLKSLVEIEENEFQLLGELESVSQKLFLVMIKFELTMDKAILDRGIRYIDLKKNLELQLFSLVRGRLNN